MKDESRVEFISCYTGIMEEDQKSSLLTPLTRYKEIIGVKTRESYFISLIVFMVFLGAASVFVGSQVLQNFPSHQAASTRSNQTGTTLHMGSFDPFIVDKAVIHVSYNKNT